MAHKYDVVIIGSGVAGALVAWKLAEAKFNVGMIDAGEKHLETIDRDEFVEKFSEATQSGKSPATAASFCARSYYDWSLANLEVFHPFNKRRFSHGQFFDV